MSIEANTEKLTGPIEDQTWATHLQSHVVTPETSPRIHGYDVENDLAKHYGFVDTLLLTVLGELPSETTRRSLEIALQYLAPMSVAHAPTHAGMLTRLCGATRSASFAAGAFLLAEDARVLVEDHRAWLELLECGTNQVPVSFASTTSAERNSVAQLRDAIVATGHRVSALDLEITKTAAIFAVFHSCGVRSAGQLELLLILGRLACVGAEVLATEPTHFRNYPINLPPFRFEAPNEVS